MSLHCRCGGCGHSRNADVKSILHERPSLKRHKVNEVEGSKKLLFRLRKNRNPLIFSLLENQNRDFGEPSRWQRQRCQMNMHRNMPRCFFNTLASPVLLFFEPSVGGTVVEQEFLSDSITGLDVFP